MGYVNRDWEIVDYQLYELRATGLIAEGSHRVRGPRPDGLSEGRFVACLGAAQTFGALCDRPFPALLREKLETPFLNLGFGGAGPSFFLRNGELLELVNKSRLAVIQVMSGRSVSNSLFESNGTDFLIRRDNGKKVAAGDAFSELLDRGRSLGPFRLNRILPRIMAIVGQGTVKRLVRECRANYLAEYRTLFQLITVPKILFWFSKRSPDYRDSYASLGEVFGEFPQLVNREMMDHLKTDCEGYVECVTSRGSPQRLISRFTGQPVSIKHSDARPDLDSTPNYYNAYYPSSEMHEDAAAALAPVCRELMDRF